MALKTAIAMAAIVAPAAQTTPGSKTSTSGQPKTAAPWGPFAPALRPLEVHADRTVTFRLSAARAAAVKLVGEVMQGKSVRPMTKDGCGVWDVTIEPLRWRAKNSEGTNGY